VVELVLGHLGRQPVGFLARLLARWKPKVWAEFRYRPCCAHATAKQLGGAEILGAGRLQLPEVEADQLGWPGDITAACPRIAGISRRRLARSNAVGPGSSHSVMGSKLMRRKNLPLGKEGEEDHPIGGGVEQALAAQLAHDVELGLSDGLRRAVEAPGDLERGHGERPRGGDGEDGVFGDECWNHLGLDNKEASKLPGSKTHSFGRSADGRSDRLSRTTRHPDRAPGPALAPLPRVAH
jgi:hypothetical protein